jgi:hypothetical protein
MSGILDFVRASLVKYPPDIAIYVGIFFLLFSLIVILGVRAGSKFYNAPPPPLAPKSWPEHMRRRYERLSDRDKAGFLRHYWLATNFLLVPGLIVTVLLVILFQNIGLTLSLAALLWLLFFFSIYGYRTKD